MKKHLSTIAVCLFSYLFLSWTISPMKMTVSEKKPQGTYFVSSDSEEDQVAIEVYAAKRLIDENGQESEIRDHDQFIIFPSQFILGKNDKQSIRVIWKGKEKLKQEAAFRIIAEQQPVTIPVVEDENVEHTTKGMSINVITQYVSSFYVQPKGAKPKVVIKDFSKDHLKLNIELFNEGLAHKIFDSLKVQVKGTSEKKALKELVLLDEFINILPSTSRLVTLDLPKEFEKVDKLELEIL